MMINGRKAFLIVFITIFAAALCMLVILTVYTFRFYKNDDSAQDKITIELMSPWVGMNQRALALDSLIEKYNNSQDKVRIVNKSVAPDSFYDKLNTDFSSGNYHDIIVMPPNYASDRYIDMGYIIPIQEALDNDEEWKNLFDKSTLKLITIGNEIYAMPYEVVYQAMFYNTDLFDRYNLEYPQTFEDLIRVCEVFKQHDIVPIAANFNYEGSYLLENIFAAYFPNINIQEIYKEEGEAQFNKVIDRVNQLYTNGAFPENAFQLSDYETRELFLNKKAAMIIEESAFISEITNRINKRVQSSLEKNNTDMNIKIGCFPFMSDSDADSTAIIYGLGEGTFFVTDNCVKGRYEEYIYDFLHFISQPEQAKFFSEETYTISSIKSLNSNSYYSNQMQQGFTLVYETCLPMQPPSMFFGKSNWLSKVVKKMPYVLEGQMSSQDMWQELKEFEIDREN